jgi:site-specific DNA recombinase
VPSEAAIVRRIFTDFSEGLSAKAIAKRLNADGTAGPQGEAWSPSTIHGHTGRGTGILNNELYIGRLVWNRRRYIKNPDTGRRVSRPNPPSEWILKDVPELRIIDDDLWQAVKTRQAEIRRVHAKGLVRLREPKYLFSGLTKCGVCGAAMCCHHILGWCASTRAAAAPAPIRGRSRGKRLKPAS